MGATVTSTFLALSLLSFAHASMLSKYKASRNKGLFLKKQKSLVLLSVEAEKNKEYDLASYFYYKLLVKKYRRAFINVNVSIKKGNFIEAVDVPKAMRILIWRVFFNNYKWLMQQDEISSSYQRRSTALKKFSEILYEIEFRDVLVEKVMTRIESHTKALRDKKSESHFSFYTNFISWQKQASIEVQPDNTKSDLYVTNKGLCAGINYSYRNAYRAWELDTCFAYGSGNVSAGGGSGLDYQQSNIPFYGIKSSVGYSRVVSDNGAQFGVRLPVYLVKQSLETPSASGKNIYVNEGEDINVLLSVYSKWPFERFYFQTEFSKFLGQEVTMWSLGAGINF